MYCILFNNNQDLGLNSTTYPLSIGKYIYLLERKKLKMNQTAGKLLYINLY